MDNNTYEKHIRRLDNQIQALKNQLALTQEICSQLVYRLQLLECGQTDITDPHYCQLQGQIQALETIRPLKRRGE